jgi:hypothetical protein
MKLRLFVICALAAVSARASVTEKFFEHLTPEERRAAGIADLTPEQQAALSVLADRWVSAKAEPAINAARQKAVAEVRAVAKAEAKAEFEAEKKSRAGLAEKSSAPEVDVIRSRIAGTFRQWGPNTRFRLDNGQVWVADRSSESRFFGTLENPEVEIRPAPFGTWKLTLVSEGLWLRVKRIE